MLLVSIAGCGLFTSTTTMVSSASVDKKENGFLVELPGSSRTPQVEALVTQRYWVIVTIVDPLYDLEPLDRFSSPHVDSLEVARFTSAVQVSLRFRREVAKASVVSVPSDPSILISVFQR